MSTKTQVETQAKKYDAPAAARIPQPLVAEPEHEAERPDIAAQLEGAARLGHSLGAVGVDSFAPPAIQRQEIPEEEEEELQMMPATPGEVALQRQEIPEEEEEELQMKREPAAIQRQDLPEAEEEEFQMMPAPAGQVALQRQELPEEEDELMLKPDDQRVGPQGGQVPPEVEAAIRRARDGGQPLEGALQEMMSASLSYDFSRVRVHTDAEADALNRHLSAKAFTTGADIFFKHGAYDPASSVSRGLIAHELSHVVQQGTGRVRGVGNGMTARPAGDPFEQAADDQARQVERQRAVANPAWPCPANSLPSRGCAGKRPTQWYLSAVQVGRSSATTPSSLGMGRPGVGSVGSLKLGARGTAGPPLARARLRESRPAGHAGGPVQRDLDEELAGSLGRLGYEVGDVFAQYNPRGLPAHPPGYAAWKGHIGVRAEDRPLAARIIGDILCKWRILHKFEVLRYPRPRDPVAKFVTIYPPIRLQGGWPALIRLIEEAMHRNRVSAIASRDVVPVGRRGIVGLRHGGISPVLAKELGDLGLKLGARVRTREGLSLYELRRRQPPRPRQWLYPRGGPLPQIAVYPRGVVMMHAYRGEGGPLVPALVWARELRPDLRQEPSPFGAKLPAGVTPWRREAGVKAKRTPK